jgi:hypothetical protein
MVNFIHKYGYRANAVINLDAVKFAAKLDGLPLILTTVGAYFDQMATNFANYFR